MKAFEMKNNANKTAAYFGVLKSQVPARVGAQVAKGSQQLEAMIKSKAPVRTGRYRASISTIGESPTPFHYSASIGSDLDYGHMLEFGGVGLDWNGNPIQRHPHPHFRPAIVAFEPMFITSIERVLT